MKNRTSHGLLLFFAIAALPLLASAQSDISTPVVYDDFTASLGKSEAEKKPILLFLGTEKSAASKKIDTEILASPLLKEALVPYVLARINGETADGEQVKQAYGWTRPPLLAILNSSGEIFALIDLSSLTEDLVTKGTATEIAARLNKEIVRFRRYGPRGYRQTALPDADPVRGILSEWETIKGSYAKEPSVMLLDDQRLSYDGNTAPRWHRHIIQILGPMESVRSIGTSFTFWNKDATFSLIKARVITPDLQVRPVEAADVEETTGYLNYPSYAHVRTEHLLFPGTKKGCVIEFEYEIAKPPQMPGQLSPTVDITDGKYPVIHSHCQLSVPAGMNVEARVIRNASPVVRKTEGGTTVLTVDGHSEHVQTDKEPGERDLPVSEYVVFSTLTKWDEIGKWFLSLTNTGRDHSPDLDRWIDSAVGAVAPGPDRERRVADAILRAMYQDFRYLALDISESGYQPHPVLDTFRNKYGDCKDFSLFLQEALKRAGIGSSLVLLNTANADPLDETPPHVPFFNHCIVRIETPGGPLYADPANRTLAGILPFADQGRRALVCDDTQIAAVTLPPMEARENTFSVDLTAEDVLSPSPSIRLDLSYSGYAKSVVRPKFSQYAKEIFDARNSSWMKPYFKDCEVTAHRVDNNDDTTAPLAARFDVKPPGFIANNDESLALPAFVNADLILPRLPRRVPNRSGDDLLLDTGERSVPIVERLHYTLPAGVTFTPPPPLHVETGYFTVDRACDVADRNLTVTTSIVNKTILGPSRYVRDKDLPPEARNLAARISQPLVVAKSPGLRLREACLAGNRQKVGDLLAAGAPIESPDEAGNTPLLLAADRGYTDIVKDLLARKADLNARNHENSTALTLTLEHRHADTGDVLIDAGADVTLIDDDHAAALNHAAGQGLVPSMARLLEKGADLNLAAYDGTPLYIAAKEAKIDAVKFLLAQKPDLTRMPEEHGGDSEFNYSLPGFAIVRNSPELLTLLLDNGVDPNAADPQGRTPLSMAAIWNRPAIITLLLARGAAVDTADHAGTTPLMYAAEYGRDEAVKLLLAGGASLDSRDENGLTPLIVAAAYYQENSLRSLIAAGADPNAADRHGETALAYVEARGWANLTKALLDKGANPVSPHVIAASEAVPPLTPAQSWALSLAAFYFQKNGDPQQVLGNLKPLHSSQIQKRKNDLKANWNVTDTETLLQTLRQVRTEGVRNDWAQRGRPFAAMSDAAFQSYVKGPLVKEEKRAQVEALRKSTLKWKERSGLGFDLFRYAHLVSQGVCAGYLTPQQAWDLLMPVARTAQKNFSSWPEIGENFLDGRAVWNETSDPADALIVKLLGNPEDANSPWNHSPWSLDLGVDGKATADATP